MKGEWGKGPPRDDLEKLAMLGYMLGGRRGRGSPFGHHGGPPFGGERGRRRRGDVRAAVLMLLAEEPRNGYQLMQTIEERSGGRWRPSPGSVYPTLAQLEDEGLIRATERDGAKLFEITDEGRRQAERHGGGSAPWESDDDPLGSPLTEIGAALLGLGKAALQVAHVGHQAQTKEACEVLDEARRSLYRILAEERQAAG